MFHNGEIGSRRSELPNSISERGSRGLRIASTPKSKPCTKFFSTSGCPYGQECHFRHYVPGGVSSLDMSLAPNFHKTGGFSKKMVSSIGGVVSILDQGPATGGYKIRLCNKYGTPEGCRFGADCHFAHGENEICKVSGAFEQEFTRPGPPRDYAATHSPAGQYDGRSGGGRVLSFREQTPPGITAAALFGAPSNAKVIIDAPLAGIIIGKGGVNVKKIYRITGAKLFVQDHESDSKCKKVELEGSFQQIRLATQMVQELIIQKDALPTKSSSTAPRNYKTKMCENFSKGSCSYGIQCLFAHGPSELRQSFAP